MSAPKGNNYNKKWKTSEERKKAFADLCEHLRKGYSKKSFPLADWQTVEAYIRDFPEDFETEKLEQVMREHLLEWERIGLEGAKGEIQGFNSTSWIFNMKNRFPADWREKQTTEHEVSGAKKMVIEWGE